MMEHEIKPTMLQQFETKLLEEEKSDATREKYLRDLHKFIQFLDGMGKKVITKERMIRYKLCIAEKYSINSANSMLASVNQFLKAMGWGDCVVKAYKVQRTAFRAKERELSKQEYYRLLDAAKRRKNWRLYLLIETIGATGIRVSELRFITVEALRTGRAKVSLKGKTRTIILPKDLRRDLKKYIQKAGIKKGNIFVTRNGKPLDRSNILHAMKSLCKEANVQKSKVFPHNLRHLFAFTYYQMEKDICHLADILGHSNINTTRIYTLMSSDEQEKQINRLRLIPATIQMLE